MEKISIQIARNLDKIHLLRRIAIQQSSAKVGIYFGPLPLLRYVSFHPGCTQKDAASHLQVSAPNITAMVKRMTRAGLLQKRADPKNLRCNSLFITPRGEDTLSRSIQVFEGIDSRMFANFSEDELCQLHDYTTRLLENVTDPEFRSATRCSLMELLKKMENQAHAESPQPPQEQEELTLD